MRDYGEKQRIAKFIRAITSTRCWLDENFDEAALSAKARELIKTLRAYLVYCEHQINAGRVKVETLQRRQHKIEGAMVELWKLSQDREE